MFHRVKSEVHEVEQKDQDQSETSYSKEEEISSRPRVSEKETVSEDEAPVRKFGYTPKVQESKSDSHSDDDDSVQGKYARTSQETERETSETSRPSYKPSVARPSYGASPSYTAPSYTPPQAPEAPAYSGSDRILTIGRGINMSGEIDSCDHLLVEGTVEAALKGAKVLDIAESGTFYGTVEIEEATVAGRFEGDITVSGRLTLKSTGVITGSVAYRQLEVEAGAVLDGRLTPLKGEVDQKSLDRYRSGSEASVMAKSTKDSRPSKKDSREIANADSALFSKARASY